MDKCEYCDCPTYAQLQGDGHRTSTVYYCSNEHCPDELTFCDQCDEGIHFEGGQPIPCGCVQVKILRDPYLLGMGRTRDPLTWLKRWMRQTYMNESARIEGFRKEGDHTFYDVEGGLTFVTGGDPVLCDSCGGQGIVEHDTYIGSGCLQAVQTPCTDCDGTGRAA